MRDGWGFVRDGPLPSGVREGATTVLSVPPASSCPGFLSAGALSARLACTWASARETGVHLGVGQDLATADAVLLCVRLVEQLLSFGVVVAGAAHHGLQCRQH